MQAIPTVRGCRSRAQMKGICLAAIFSLLAHWCRSQTFASFYPAFTNSPGSMADKANVAVEIGRQWDVFSMGLDLGKTTLAKVTGRDTSVYLELRPNLNIFQEDKFTLTLTAGIGYIFHARQNLMTELTSGIEYSYSQRIHYNIYLGQYYYSGRYEASNVTFLGLSVMFYFSPFKDKSNTGK